MKILIHDSEGTLLLEKHLVQVTSIIIDPEAWSMQITDGLNLNTVVDLESEDTFAISFLNDEKLGGK